MNKTLDFAAAELKKYTAQMEIETKILLSVEPENFDKTHFFKFDQFYDDAFSVEVCDGEGKITGTNQRAVLFGVYHFLKKQGCRFLRPGKDGEYIPVTGKVLDVYEVWYAASRHRGLTDGNSAGEGGDIDMLLAFIDWMPKMMMNTFFIELTDAYSAMQLRYNNPKNPYLDGTFISRTQYDVFESWIRENMQKRSILRHGAGHGWTVTLMEGVGDTTRDTDNANCTNKEILAQIDGKREFFGGKPLNTNLCYSNKRVQKALAESVYKYSIEHPQIDLIHFWLADNFNNFCTCENCSALSPSDWYVQILNEIDAVFTEHASNKKIVFLIYFELLYPPLKERILNEDRFVMMFAPYGRDFTKAYTEWDKKPYTRAPENGYKRSDMNMEWYLTQLAEWQQQFHGDSFVFDYSLFDSASHADVTDIQFSHVPYYDSIVISEFGLNGRIECGDMRAMTPTALAMHGTYSGLFYGKSISYEEICENYFTGLYGEKQPVWEFLKEVSQKLPYFYMLCRKRSLTKAEKTNISDGLKLVRTFRKKLSLYFPAEAVHRQNCKYFLHYIDILEAVFVIIQDKITDCADKKLEDHIENFRHLVFEKEMLMPIYMSGTNWYAHLKNTFCNKIDLNEF